MNKLETRNEYYNTNVRYYADEKRATSYKWWTFVNVINGKTMFNNHNYSKTTKKHQWAVLSLMKSLGHKIDIFIDMEETLTKENFEKYALYNLYDEAIELIIINNTPRTRKSTIKDNRKKINAIKEQIALLKKLGAKMSYKNMFSIYRSHKKDRDDLIKARKEMKKQLIYQDKLRKNELYKIVKNNARKKEFLIKNIDNEKKREVNYFWFFNEFKQCPLATAMYGEKQ